MPSASTGRFFASIFSTAMSVLASAPSTLARYSRRSVSLTVTSFASFTTWALVMMMPLGSTMKPEPCERTGTARCCCCWPRGPICPWKWRKNWNIGSSGSMPCSCAMVSSSEAFSVPVTLMLTTAGPSREVMVEKSGKVTIAAGAATAAVVAGAPTARALV
ncbi:hypothetical protein D9M68_834740 [compost metagenome]